MLLRPHLGEKRRNPGAQLGNAAKALESLGSSPQEGRRIVEENILNVADNIIFNYAPQFRALQSNQLPRLLYGIEEIFNDQGIEAAKQLLEEWIQLKMMPRLTPSKKNCVKFKSSRSLLANVGGLTPSSVVRDCYGSPHYPNSRQENRCRRDHGVPNLRYLFRFTGY